jgi:glycosyltransferase involved in cell wall biosynthesis
MRQKNNKISIVLPTFNGAKYIKNSIDSCLNQTYINIELIIVDDASKDNTPEIVSGYSDKRIMYVRNETNLGLANSLNKGFSHATGDYLTWTSDDNSYFKNAIEVMMAELEGKKKIDFVYTDFYIIDENGNLKKIVKLKSPKKLTENNYVGPCFLYKRRVYETVGDFNPAVNLAEDYEYWLRVKEKFRMKRIRKHLYYYRLHADSLTGKYSDIERMIKLRKLRNDIRDKYISGAMRDYFEGEKLFYENDYINAKTLLIKSLLRKPCSLNTFRMLLIIYLSSGFVEKIRKIKRRIIGLCRRK